MMLALAQISAVLAAPGGLPPRARKNQVLLRLTCARQLPMPKPGQSLFLTKTGRKMWRNSGEGSKLFSNGKDPAFCAYERNTIRNALY